MRVVRVLAFRNLINLMTSSTTSITDKLEAEGMRKSDGNKSSHDTISFLPPSIIIDENSVQKYVLIGIEIGKEMHYFVRGSRDAELVDDFVVFFFISSLTHIIYIQIS